MNLRKQTVLFVIFLCIPFLGLLSYAQSVSNDEHSSLEVGVLRKIASHSINKAFENSKNLGESAAVIGIEPLELQMLCLALDITIPFDAPEVEPVPVVTSGRLADDNLEPEVIVEYLGASPYIIIVEKNSHTLFLLKYENGIKTVIDTFNCQTGKNHGDKKISGDEKTPEGIYFMEKKYSRKQLQKLVGKNNAFKYGELAYVTDFPNAVDSLHGKKGSGIWLHGTDEPFESTSSFNTRGCVVTTNETIKTLSKYIVLRKTPLIIVEHLSLLNINDTEQHKQKVHDLLEGWKSAWEHKSLDDYIGFYSQSFTSQGLSRSGWKQDKRKKWDRNNNIQLTIYNPVFLKHNGNLVVTFDQIYSIKNTDYSTTGSKTLYFISEQDTWKIIAEHFR